MEEKKQENSSLQNNYNNINAVVSEKNRLIYDNQQLKQQLINAQNHIAQQNREIYGLKIEVARLAQELDQHDREYNELVDFYNFLSDECSKLKKEKTFFYELKTEFGPVLEKNTLFFGFLIGVFSILFLFYTIANVD